jgi:hypothetical protein
MTPDDPKPIGWLWKSDNGDRWQFSDGADKPDLGFPPSFEARVTYKAVFSPDTTAMLPGEFISWESTTPVYTKYITDRRYRKFSGAAQGWYKPYRCSNCSDPAEAAKAERSPVEAAYKAGYRNGAAGYIGAPDSEEDMAIAQQQSWEIHRSELEPRN